MSATRGHIVLTPGEDAPYKIVLEHEGSNDTEQPVQTVGDGEAIIKRETPVPPERDTSFDRPANST